MEASVARCCCDWIARTDRWYRTTGQRNYCCTTVRTAAQTATSHTRRRTDSDVSSEPTHIRSGRWLCWYTYLLSTLTTVGTVTLWRSILSTHPLARTARTALKPRREHRHATGTGTITSLASVHSFIVRTTVTVHVSYRISISLSSTLILASLPYLSRVMSGAQTDTIQPAAAGKQWRWGVMGSGGICQDFSHALRDCVPDAVLQAIGARTLASAEKVKGELGFQTAYGSFEEVAADPNVDVVYVGSVHNKHHEHTMLALKHGKPVLVEKAFMQNAKQAEEIFKIAKGRILELAHNHSSERYSSPPPPSLTAL